ncbi:TonB-dependent receptor [Bacteroides sp. 519]|uniref:SusC/RagA family TonB-linked outer membrane protein n=1 Tax=Bacteroides sp. 519 TaxID=2302937 RepID=UPI0013D80313|nr:TonB-dependent receptor [Bacteroides sp. 519]NDV59315.1 TonB-dependent receptor [Bacteroides sp. 519]
MKRKLMLLLTCLFVSIGLVTAQTQTVTGTVISEEDGQPVVGASVLVKGTTNLGTITDIDGNFSISNVPSSAKTLLVSYIGMISQEVAIKPNQKIFLKPDSQLIDEVIVVAFGTAKKSAFTGSAKVVGAEKLEQSQVTNVTDALAGAVPGVTLTSNNGAPGAKASIKIRGFSSLNAGNDPLIVVDGAPYSGDISNINPNDVESMTVLKDAASNALYGARGANGVIIITTKRANMSGEAKVSFDAKWGANTRALQKYDVISDPGMFYETHYTAMNNYYKNQMGMSDQAAWLEANKNLFGTNGGLGYNVYTVPDGQYLIGQNGKLNPNATLGRVVNYKGRDYLLTPDDWSDVGLRTGLRQEYNFSVSGTNEKSSFYLSLGYLGNEGITKGSDLQRFTGRLKADYQAKKWMKIGGNMAYARYETNSLGNNGSSSSTANVWAFISQMAPIYPAYVRNADGSIMMDKNNLQMMDYGSGINAGMQRPFIADANPIQDNKLNTRNAEGNALNGNAFVDITPLPGLKVTLNGTFNLDETRFSYVYNPYYGQFDSTGGTVSKYHQRIYDYNLQQLVSYANSFGSNNFDILLGHEYYDYRFYNLSASKSQMFSQENKELDGAIIDGQSASSYKNRRNNEGYFGRLQYNYDERIFGSASLRRDASSRFHPDHRWGTFWSVGGAWLINKETWFDVSWVQELKVKASVGSQGNDNIGEFRYVDRFNIINSNNILGTSFNTKGTKDITWETNTNFNIGAEFQLWNRVSGSIEYYRRKTSDMLFSFSVAPSLGYSAYVDNVGDMVNSGVEMDFNVNIFDKRNFTWDINLNISTLKNRITMLDPDKLITTEYTAGGKGYKGYSSGNFFIGEDLSMFTWRMKEYAGVDEEGRALYYKNTKDEAGNITGRETTWNHSNADYYITEKSSIPKVYGGFGTKLKVYGVDFGINFTYQLGGKQYDGTYAYFMTSPKGSAGYNYHKDILNSWTPENTSANIPRFQMNDDYSASMSTRFLTDASFLNIQNINVGYTLPSKWTKKMAVNSLRVYMSAENVFYWSKRKGFDPRQSYSETTNATYYSPMRTVSGGVSFEF